MIIFILTTFVGILLSNKGCICSRTNFQVKHLKLCGNTQGLIKYHGNITREGDDYYTSNRIDVPIPLDENIGCLCKIESKIFNSYVELFTFREKYFCKAANMYLGEFWYDVERAALMMAGKCPILAGRYELHHYLLDFKKISLQTLPFGVLRFTTALLDNRNPQRKLICVVMEVENTPVE